MGAEGLHVRMRVSIRDSTSSAASSTCVSRTALARFSALSGSRMRPRDRPRAGNAIRLGVHGNILTQQPAQQTLLVAAFGRVRLVAARQHGWVMTALAKLLDEPPHERRLA